MGITSLLFISTAIIFWASDFCFNVLKARHEEILSVFVIVCVSGPVLGTIIGGAIVDKFAGGYAGKHSISFSFIFAILAFACTSPIRIISGLYSFSLLLWGVLFFGGAVIPSLQGAMISSLNNDLRAAGNSITNILQNLLGFLPAPFVYGFIYEISKKSDPKLAMTVTLWSSAMGLIFIGLAMAYRLRNWKSSQFDKIEIDSGEKRKLLDSAKNLNSTNFESSGEH